MTLDVNRLGRPIGNGFIKSFDGGVRAESRSENCFLSLENGKEKIEAWRVDYIEQRPHSVSGNLAQRISLHQAELSRRDETLIC